MTAHEVSAAKEHRRRRKATTINFETFEKISIHIDLTFLF